SSFLLTELAALISAVVYMAKRDERTFNRYKLRSLLNPKTMLRNDEKPGSDLVQERGKNQPARFARGRHFSQSVERAPSFDSIASPWRKNC
ncbi:hypothetical protein KIN20_031014, partial [Parelaphostrongylus tenuis]